MPLPSKEQLIHDARDGFKGYDSPSVSGRWNRTLLTPAGREPKLVIKRAMPDQPEEMLKTEYELARLLEERSDELSFDVPRTYLFNDDPLFAAFHWVPGETIGNGQMSELPPEQRIAVAASLGKFTAELARAVPVPLYEATMGTLPRMPTREERFLELQEWVDTLQDSHPLKAVYADIKEQIRAREASEATSPPVVVHSDLHADNLLFRDGEVTGVIDFDNMAAAPPEVALRFVPHLLGEKAVQASTMAYADTTGEELDPSLIAHYSRIHLATLAALLLQNGQPLPPRVSAALAAYYPEIMQL